MEYGFVKTYLMAFTLIALTAGSLWAEALTHSEFQGVDGAGEHTFASGEKVTLEGIMLNRPADMLDPTPDEGVTQMYNLAGQWQVFFQGEGNDHAGTAVWMGQLYGNLPRVRWMAATPRLNGWPS